MTPSPSTGGSTNKTMGSYKILSRWSGKAIDIPYGSKDQGTTLELCEDNNQANQRWMFKRSTD